MRRSRERAGSRPNGPAGTAGCGCGPLRIGGGDTTAERRYDGLGYVTFGAGRCQHQVTNVSVGGGRPGFSVERARNGRGFGIGGINVGYHFVNRDKPAHFDPFVYGGPLGVGCARGGLAGAGSLGGGLN